jgi:hypothetical protein
VPRWVGDANFMAVVGGSQVMPVSLPEVWARLREHWHPDGTLRT